MENALTTLNNNVSVLVHTPPPGTSTIAIRRAIAQSPIVENLQPIERSVFLASTAKVAQEYTDVELANVMADTLKWVAKDIGVRDTESADWKVSIVRFVQIFKRYYPAFSVKDVRMAFELMVTGELNDYLPKNRFGQPDKEHYQMFNADYFCKVMNAYKGYRAAIINKAAAMVPKPVAKRNTCEDAYYRNSTRKRVIEMYLFYKYRGYMPPMNILTEMLLYMELEQSGLAETFEVTEQEQRVALQMVISELTQRQMVYDVKRITAQGTQSPDIQNEAYRIARKAALKRAFAQMVADEIQVAEYFKMENENGHKD